MIDGNDGADIRGISHVGRMMSAQRKCVLHHIYLKYLRQINTIVITILSAIKWAIAHQSSSIIDIVSLFVYVVHFSGDAHCRKTGNIVK